VALGASGLDAARLTRPSWRRERAVELDAAVIAD
jgi:hypothetical protein